MNSLNSVLIEGNLVRDPVLNETPKGTKICNFTIATNRYFKQDEEYQKEVSFIDVEAWSRLGVVCDNGLQKGQGARVVGRLKQDRWNDKEGAFKSRLKIVAEHVEFKPVFSKEDAQTRQEAEQVDLSQEAVANVVTPELDPVADSVI